MDPNSVFSIIGTVGFLISSAINVSRRIIEVRDVEKQAQDVLQISNGIRKILQQARKLRRQRSQLLSALEKDMIDVYLDEAEEAIGNVALLIEPARADMQTNNGSVSITTRGWFVFKDGPRISASLIRLQFAHQGLNTAVNILCGHGPIAASTRHETQSEHKYPPPSYEDSQFLNSKRHAVVFGVQPPERVERVERVEIAGPVELSSNSAAEAREARQARQDLECEPLIEVSPAVLPDGPDMSRLQVNMREREFLAAFDRIRQPQQQPFNAGRAHSLGPESTGNQVATARRFGGRSRGQVWLAHKASFQT